MRIVPRSSKSLHSIFGRIAANEEAQVALSSSSLTPVCRSECAHCSGDHLLLLSIMMIFYYLFINSRIEGEQEETWLTDHNNTTTTVELLDGVMNFFHYLLIGASLYYYPLQLCLPSRYICTTTSLQSRPSIHPSVYTYQNKKNRYTTFVVGGDKQSVFAI